jgi:hypothetical protein
MQEAFLHFIWRTRRFDTIGLSTTAGHMIQLLHPGEHNTNAGPDFFNARLRIDDTEWAGNVEMHLRSSEWLVHGHDTDLAYQSVVLHVVWIDDEPVLRSSGDPIPCLVLKDRVAPVLLHAYERLLHEEAWIPCAGRFGEVPGIVRLNWFDRLLVERLEQKTAQMAIHLAATDNHWEEAFYRTLARSFGLKVNTEPFEALARSLPLILLTKHKNDLHQLEALLFGQAGLLEEPFKDEYPRSLAKEYRFLKHKYGLHPLTASQWKFLRMRPANFPTVRIAQFAALIYHSTHLFGQILEAGTARNVAHLFALPASSYWENHFCFDAESIKRTKIPGRDFIDLLLINAIIPALFYYGKTRQIPEHTAKALRWLEELPAESNHLVAGWEPLGIEPGHAYESQALLQLKTHYCDKKRCLDCAIGGFLLK